MLTVPVSTASADRSFSKLKLIKIYLRSTMSQERLSALSVLSIEAEIAASVTYDIILKKCKPTIMKKSEYFVSVRPTYEELFYPWLTYQVFFAVHSPFVPINPFIYGRAMKPGYVYDIYIRVEEEHLLPHPYRTNCTDYVAIWKKNNRTGPRSQQMCRDMCRKNYSKQCYGCEKGMTMFEKIEDMCFPLQSLSDCVVRRCLDQRIEELSIKRRLGSGHPRQTSRRENCHIVRNARLQPTASSAAILTQVEPLLGDHVSSHTIRRRLVEGHLGSWRPLRVLPLTPTHRRLRLEWCHTRGNWTAAEWNQVVFSDESRFNLSGDDNRVRISYIQTSW
ncbi:transposable element Tcb2 transposase [Trichonephila clavipes]|nr:transposable element Tcb2 transposase [Trichonephila clavipes]